MNEEKNRSNRSNNPGTGEISSKIILNRHYGPDPAQSMDIYLPAARTADTTNLMVLIHGGGFTSGDKSELTGYIKSLQQRLPGYAFFNVTYRQATSPETLFPTQENDLKAALEFIIENSNGFAVSKKMVLLGVSAGGSLALLQGYKYDKPVKPKAVISFFGPTDLVDLYYHPTNPLVPAMLTEVMGKTPEEDPSIYINSSPVNFVSTDSPPTVLLQGGQDPLVGCTQQTMLEEKLRQAGVAYQYIFYDDKGHGWDGATLDDSFDKIGVFLRENVE